MHHEKDILEKHILEKNDVFADICRLVVPGMEHARAEEFESETTPDFFVNSDSISEVERDIVKRWIKENKLIYIVGIENQTQKDATLSLRIMNCNSVMYQRFLSRKQKPVPVITFVLYFGIEKAWDQARSIHEILDIPKELKRFIPDFRAEVIDLGALSNEMIDSLKSDLKEIARFIKTVRNGENQFNTSKKLDHFALVGHLLSILTSKKSRWKLGNHYKKEVKKKWNTLSIY
ncbi:Rpn family recombination-promoting nuclease/putative transposase [Dubosiella newyorkensis]|uniref:Transposase (putative) YhgA-like domain-containing protein n=1 Tax=Dubosiella newyorkensis TaxID=1862672 RepID=A0A1U7NQG5_9FIRM|nr:Rpn family recombination-promoting nuclease/putative transposase [Dubosiella newyorkensis]OLU47875.1 hypothetical protein BO225_00890 [Dubosiella newyorkensis]